MQYFFLPTATLWNDNERPLCAIFFDRLLQKDVFNFLSVGSAFSLINLQFFT